MQKPIIIDASVGLPDSVFGRRIPGSTPLHNGTISPQSQISLNSHRDPMILCKKIDKSPQEISLKGDLSSMSFRNSSLIFDKVGQKFVPLAIPLEHMKKKHSHGTLPKADFIPTDVQNQRPTSMPQTTFHSSYHSRAQSMSQTAPVSQNTSHHFQYNSHEVLRPDPHTQNLQQKGSKSQRVYEYDQNYVQDAYKSSLAESRGLMDKLLGRTHNKDGGGRRKKPKLVKKEKTTQARPRLSQKSKSPNKVSPLTSPKNITIKAATTKAKDAPKVVFSSSKVNNYVGTGTGAEAEGQKVNKENQVVVKRVVRDKKSGEKGTRSGKSSKASSPVKIIENKESKRKVKKREFVSKSEVPPAVEEMIHRNAQVYLEEIKAKKQMDELEKRLNEERKIAFNEGNRMIRESNLHRFTPIQHARSQSKFAWGVDQRKFQDNSRKQSPTHERYGSIGMNTKSKILDDRERRKVLGLDHLDEATIHHLHEKALRERENFEATNRYEDRKSKKEMDDDEKMRIHEYMIQKRIKMEHDKHVKQIHVNEDLERKRKNLDKLFTEIRSNRDIEVKRAKAIKRKSKRKSNKRRFVVDAPQGSPISSRVMEGNQTPMDDDNYSTLYREYKKIVQKKGASKENSEIKNKSGNDSHSRMTHPQPGSDALERSLRSQLEAKLLRAQEIQKHEDMQKREEMKQRYFELSDRYQRNLANNMHVLENKMNSSSKRISPIPSKSERSSTAGEQQRDYNYNYNYRQPEESDRVYDTEGNLPEESAREIIEAAAIFIQKNFRGYRIRKQMRMIFEQLYQEELEEYEEGEEGDVHRMGEYVPEEDDELEHDEGEEEEYEYDESELHRMRELQQQNQRFNEYAQHRHQQDHEEVEYGQEEVSEEVEEEVVQHHQQQHQHHRQQPEFLDDVNPFPVTLSKKMMLKFQQK